MKRTLIIAEAGVNHNGDFTIAKKLIDVAAEAGADFVKFQTFNAKKLVSKSAAKADYQVKNIDDGDGSQYNMLKKLEMPEAWYQDLKDYASEKNIRFVSTGFDEESVDFLEAFDMPFFKIPSGEITNKPYLVHIAGKKKPVIMSTGMADQEEVKAAMDVLLAAGMDKEQITILHCNTDYPTAMQDVNLLAMNAIKRDLAVAVGYSDHTLGIEVPIAAVALGATVIEKHFTLDRLMPGPDHAASLEPFELRNMVTAIRNIELAIIEGGIKQPSASEIKNRQVARKSIHLNKAVPAGHVITAADLEMKRPGDGISPMDMEQVIGKKVNSALPEEYKLSLKDLA